MNLPLHAMTSLHHAAEDYPGIGWVRGDFQEAPEVNNEFREIQSNHWRLQHEVTDLTEKLNGLSSAVYSAFMDKISQQLDLRLQIGLKGRKQIIQMLNIECIMVETFVTPI